MASAMATLGSIVASAQVMRSRQLAETLIRNANLETLNPRAPGASAQATHRGQVAWAQHEM